MESKPPPSIHHLRNWQRSRNFSSVIDALLPRQTDCTPQEKAVLALALTGEDSAKARPLLQEVSGQIPSEDDPMWCSDVGMVCLYTGNINKALELIRNVADASAATAVDVSRMAAVCFTMGDLKNAARYYQQAVFREPGQAIWHNNLAGIQVRQQLFDNALENYDIALTIDPDMAQAKNSRQQVLLALERTEEVILDLENNLAKNPQDISIRIRLARALNQDNKFTPAINVLRDALVPVAEVTMPDKALSKMERSKTTWAEQIELRMELAGIFEQRSMHKMALQALQQVEKLEPDHMQTCLAAQARCLTELGRYDAALEKLDAGQNTLQSSGDYGASAHESEELVRQDTQSAAIDGGNEDRLDTKSDTLGQIHAHHSKLYAGHEPLDGTSLPVLVTRAYVLCEKGDYEASENILRNLLHTYPGHAGILGQLGQTLLWTGKVDEAADCFERASRINPMALAQMVNARRIPEDVKALEKMRQFADNPLQDNAARSSMAFALAEVYDKQKDADTAWTYLSLANRLVDKQLGYRPEMFSSRVESHQKIFTRQFFADQPSIRGSQRTPIFIVGMPRSGTTLTEQILCTHPDIFGAGELDLIPRLVQLMPKATQTRHIYPECMHTFTPHLREEAARFYLHGLDTYDKEHPFVVDKMPHNFMHLGLISLIFPKAKIIHIRRDPRDTALSNFQQNFKARHGGLGYAFDLKKIALQINDYHRMMQHWREVLPLRVFEIKYEDLVGDQDYWSHKLLEFAGVDWDEQVMDFYKTERAVRTASVTQVRQPIYQTSKQKWRRYEHYLGPLLDNLNPETTADWDG